MKITEFYQLIGATPHAPASEADIAAAEERLNGKLPAGLRAWFLEADGFPGEAEINIWRFKSLRRLHTIDRLFPGTETIKIATAEKEPRIRVAQASRYAVFCDCLINLPLYATNICVDDPHYEEIISAHEEEPSKAWLSAKCFDDLQCI